MNFKEQLNQFQEEFEDFLLECDSCVECSINNQQNIHQLITDIQDLRNKIKHRKIDRKPLFEHRGDSVSLCEHRGKPDPIKARQRQEAHLRGLERSKNAQKRRLEAQERRTERQRAKLEREKQKSQKKQELQDKIDKIKNKQQQSQQKDIEQQYHEQKKEVDSRTSQFKQQNNRVEQSLATLDKAAPNQESRDYVSSLKNQVATYKQESASELESILSEDLSPEERQKKLKEFESNAQQKLDSLGDFDDDKDSKRDKTTSNFMSRSKEKTKEVMKGMLASCMWLIGYDAPLKEIKDAAMFVWNGGK